MVLTASFSFCELSLSHADSPSQARIDRAGDVDVETLLFAFLGHKK